MLTNQIINMDCISFLNKINQEYPDGCFDLIFADPPYNLTKNYSNSNDNFKEEYYIHWCNEWLSLCAKSLKPNGSLFILNIPKWSVYHAIELNKHLYLQNWIAWNALSVPLGKIMPAHYSILHYTKNRDNFTFHQQYTEHNENECLRSKCMKNRNTTLKPVTNIWNDIHRIKHKKHRDSHPCQLPFKLMERIILMASNENDLIFDPFCGTGTTAIAAKKLNRNYCCTDISADYIDIARKNIEKF